MKKTGIFLVMYMKLGQKFVKITPQNKNRKNSVMEIERNLQVIFSANRSTLQPRKVRNNEFSESLSITKFQGHNPVITENCIR